ncbi:MAG: tRNA (guanosine(46)-N7)-methyltransferase TrmB [Eubacteriales bacterium]|nr:tRNA (guanosine(46)-N7)-methyltransferase TrmB [Eubacteriales bacterium]
MRLRHRKWADTVLSENTDIGKNLADFSPEDIATFTSLEIGSGLGGFLLELSKEHPEEKYLGIEVNANAFALAVRNGAKVKEEQKNFLFLNAPIERIFPLFQKGQLNNIYLNFSDPWPKKRQQRRRLTYPTRQVEYSRILKEDGTLYFRTDNEDLFKDSVEYFKEANLFDFEIIEPFYSEKVDYLPPTEYEKKFRSKGATIHLLIAHKKKNGEAK